MAQRRRDSRSLENYPYSPRIPEERSENEPGPANYLGARREINDTWTITSGDDFSLGPVSLPEPGSQPPVSYPEQHSSYRQVPVENELIPREEYVRRDVYNQEMNILKKEVQDIWEEEIAKIDELHKRMNAVMLCNENILKDNMNLKKAKDSMMERVGDLELKNDNLRAEVIKTYQDIESLNNVLGQKDKQMDDVMKDMEDVKKQLLSKEIEIDNIQKELLTKNTEMIDVKNELIDVKKDMDKSKKEIDHVQNELLTKTVELNDVKKDMDKSKKEIDFVCVQKELLTKTTEIIDVKNEMNDVKKDMDKSKKEMDHVQKELLTKTTEIIDVKNEMNDVKKDMDKSKKEIDLVFVQKELLTKTTEIIDVKNEMDDINKQHALNASVIAGVKKDLTEVKTDLKKKESHINNVDTEVKEIQSLFKEEFQEKRRRKELKPFSKFHVGFPSTRRLQTGSGVRMEGFSYVDTVDSKFLDRESGVYKTPTRGKYEFGGRIVQIGPGRSETYLCEDRGGRRELLGKTESHGDECVRNGVCWECEESVRVWIEVVRMDGEAEVWGCGFRGELM